MNNINEQSLKIFTAKAQADKAINSLKGILLGINLDNEVNEIEINELRKWVVTHNHMIHRNPFNEFMTYIEETLSNKIPPIETIADLYWLCQKYEGDNYYYNAVTTDLQTLQGLCHGILADGIITDKEIYDLNQWLSENEHLNTYYPYDEIRSLLLSIVSDNKINDEERTLLKAYFKQFIKLENEEIQKQIESETANVTISGLCTSEPNVSFDGKTFCITGVLKRGNRESLQNDIRKLGGVPTESITKKTDYLIVGDNGNPAWAFSCYGRKVEKALSLRKNGHTITLIHEFDFADIVDELI
ncbi:BRCT domain-containing protein [Flavobacterium sp. SUN052]|uniref:BRCT domain-containing protein n=1 Tax=Flavobacterium sp. SUN052 TaxID=3002441 RepID=UPI00237DCD91|nr:BRCT domain-containing protein [Flavobacterium sp. SUN052]MEC4004843.1 BRCT domain-containing protein [Flavobacterium sp. SUN052]